MSIARRLQRRAAQAPELIEPSVKALDEAMEALETAAQTVEAALAACDFDPRELERCEERLFALRGMARKYGVAVDALPALADKYAGELADLSEGRARVGRLELEASAAAADYASAARALSEARRKAAEELGRAVNAELPPLKLERARFAAEIASDERLVSPDGFDRVEFMVETNPGSRPGPLMKVASGGELARFLLALKVSLAHRETAPTLVFDEIDTGVGGAVADAIGQRLARLAARAQVLAVTHAPQVAARSQRHFKIFKDEVGGGARVATRVDHARGERAARGDRADACRRGDHAGGAGGGEEPDREGGVEDCRAKRLNQWVRSRRQEFCRSFRMFSRGYEKPPRRRTHFGIAYIP